jgi:uncharacterized protein (DUF1697 family)
MALVVLLRGVNVGGHKTFQPRVLADQLQHLEAVNIAAAGTFVIRRPIAQAQLRAEFACRLAFQAEIIICEGRDIIRALSRTHFDDFPERPDIVRFVTVLAERPRSAPPVPIVFPSDGKWLMKVVARENRFIFGVYRRQMKAISYLGKLDRIFGSPATTRNWNTMKAIAKVLGQGFRPPGGERGPIAEDRECAR